MTAICNVTNFQRSADAMSKIVQRLDPLGAAASICELRDRAVSAVATGQARAALAAVDALLAAVDDWFDQRAGWCGIDEGWSGALEVALAEVKEDRKQICWGATVGDAMARMPAANDPLGFDRA